MNKKEVDTHRGLQAQNVKKSTTLSRDKERVVPLQELQDQT